MPLLPYSSSIPNPLPISRGGTGSATQNFVDLSSTTNTKVGELDLSFDYAVEKIKNTSTAQYSGAGLYLLNSTSSMANEGGVSFYAGINDGSHTQGYFAFDQVTYTGGFHNHLMLFDLDANTTTFYNNGTQSAQLDASGNFNLGANIQMASEATYGYLMIQSRATSGQDDNGENTIVDVRAPSANPQESTVTLNRILSSGNREFTDVTDEDYGTDHRSSVNISKQGTGVLRPYAIRFWNQDLGNIASHGVFGVQVDPASGLGSVAIGPYSATGYDSTIGLQVLAQPSATYGFALDNGAGTHKFTITPAGVLAATGATLTGTLTGQTVTPSANATYNLGDSTHYYSNLYATTLNLNSTASLSGGTAGKIAVTGQLTTAVSGSNIAILDTADGLILAGTGGGQTAQLRITANGGAWTDAVNTAYFQIQTSAVQNMVFMGGSSGSDQAWNRLMLSSKNTTLTDFFYNAAPVPTANVEIVNGIADKIVLKLIGYSTQTHNLQEWQNSSTAVVGSISNAGVMTVNNVIETNHAVTVTSNAGTCSNSFRFNTFTNSSAATMAITIATSGAVDGQQMIVRIYDFSAVAQTIGWTNTENSAVSAPTTSNGSTTHPLTIGFIFNGATSLWRAVATA